MSASRYSIGVDFGTESARALLVDCRDGTELATAVYAYANGVIDEHLPAPDDDVSLDVDWALQDPGDYIRALGETIPAVLGDERCRSLAGRRSRHRRDLLHHAADARRRHSALRSARAPARAARLGEALEASRRPARGGSDQRRGRPARRAVARPLRRAGSRRNGSSPRHFRSSARHPRSMRGPSG